MGDAPIDKASLNKIRKALAALAEVQPLIDAALEAGLDVSEQAARAEHYRGLGGQMLKVYEPIVNRFQPRDG